MSMITQCPACATTFRVTSQQLQAQRGMVRCGRCATIFDGFKTLSSLRDVPVATPPPQPVDPAPAVVATPAPPAAAAPVSVSESAPPVVAEPSAASDATLPPVEKPPVPETPARRRAAPPPAALEPVMAEPATASRSGVWALGVAVLLLALAAQGVYFYRSEVAAYVPEARPYLNQMCMHLRCAVALPQRPRSISIEASDMQATDPANPGVIALTATLRNHATTALGYPALDVVLTNVREHTVARRVFLPAEYLDAGRDARTGIPPNAEITVKLNIDSGDLGAAGFRLDLLPAPTR